jgi:hypothetical protein
MLSAAACFLPLVALADARLQMVDSAGNVDSTYQIKGSKVRVESVESPDVALVYDAATHGMTVIDHGKKKYMRIDAETAAQAGAAMSDAMKEMEARLAELPPEQREMAKQFMPKLPGGASKLPVIASQKTGKSDSVQGVSCEIMTVTMDGEALGDACVTSKSLALSDADQQTMKTMFADMSRLASSFAGSGAAAGQQFSALDGMPLRWRDADSGRVTEMRIDAKAAVDAAAMEIPAGYAEQEIAIPSM